LKKFIEQQESTVPAGRRQLVTVSTVPVPKKRGRKKNVVNLRRLLFLRSLIKAGRSNKSGTREEFASALGLDPRAVNTLAAAFIRCSDAENILWQQRQQEIDRQMNTPEGKLTIPLLEAGDILRRDFEPKTSLDNSNTVQIDKDPDFWEKMHIFGFVMPDNCMLMDGICINDRIAAVHNIRPTIGDMVACTIPGTSAVTVRRYVTTGNPSVYELFEGGTINPMRANEIEDLILGVVIDIRRSYRPLRLPATGKKII